MPKKSTILIVDDHPLLRRGISHLINAEPDLRVCGEAEDAHQGLEAIASLKPDLAIVDISLKDTNGLELIKNIKIRYPKLPILVLSMFDESLYAERVLRAGAKGYMMKQEASEKVVIAIRRLLKDEIFLSDAMASKVLNRVAGKKPKGESAVEVLSDRELEVFQLIGQGLGTRQIAKRLQRSIKTIESYRAHIKEKMSFQSGAEIVHHAIDMFKEHSYNKPVGSGQN